MGIIQCSKGHFYDSETNASCPYCKGGESGVGVTKPLPVKEVGKTQALVQSEAVVSIAGSPEDKGKTVALMKRAMGIDPVVGWLVCTHGADKGRDYRIRGQRNFIGRSETMDICIRGDETISRENHTIISYNPKNNGFKIAPGDSKGITYLNDEEVLMPMSLSAYDVIEIGTSKLTFIPLCGERFKWE